MSTDDLRKKSLSGGVATGLEQAANTCIQVFGTAILARLLTPGDFGVIAKVAAFTGITAVLGDMGLSLATIQSREINSDQLSVLFWLNVFLGLAVGGAILCSGPLLAFFYDDPRVVGISIVLAVTAVVSSLNVQYIAMLKRDLNYNPLIISKLVGSSAGLIAAIVLAGNLHYFALLCQGVVAAVVTGVILRIYSGWTPSFILRGTGVRSMLGMAMKFTGWGFINFGVRNTDNVLIGRYWGDGPLALYTRAYGLVLRPLVRIGVPLSQIAIPALSRLQDSPEKYKSFFLRGCSISLIIQVPFSCLCFVSANELVMILLGPQWQPSVAIFLALSPVLITSSTSPMTNWIYLSNGQTGKMLKAQLVTSPFYIIAFVCGLPWGPVGVAAAFSFCCVISRMPNILYCIHGTVIDSVDLIRVFMPPFLCSVVAGVVAYVLGAFLQGTNDYQLLIAKVSVFAVVYGATIMQTTGGKKAFEIGFNYIAGSTLFKSALNKFVKTSQNNK